MNTCSTKDSEKINLLKKLGAYNCNGEININDILGFVYDYVRDGSNEYTHDINEVLSYVYYYVGIYNSNANEKETRNSLLQSIIDGNYTPESCTIDGCTGSTPSSQSSDDTRQRAQTIIADANVAFVNIRKNPNNPNQGFDIFFKGHEVLEYHVTFSGSIDNSIKTSENGKVFHNLFSANWINNNPNHAEQAFVIDGANNTVYQARRSDKNALEKSTVSNTSWSNTGLIHMFSTDSDRSISKVNKIRYASDIIDDDVDAVIVDEIIESNAREVAVLSES